MRLRTLSKTGVLAVSLAATPLHATVATSSPEPCYAAPADAEHLADAYDTLIRQYAREYAIEPALVKAIIRVESSFDPHAVSPRGARGLMQLTPEVVLDGEVADVHDPRQNIRAGVRHLSTLLGRFHNDLRLALAAYNAGRHAVIRFQGLPPYRETRQYVARVLRYQREYREQSSLA
jgi:soluble lytic murein transglycosylase-like protein